MKNTAINTIINGQRVAVEVSAIEILYVANQIENALNEQTQNIIVFAADAHNWYDGYTTPSVGIRKVDKIGGPETLAMIGDVCYLVAGTLRQIDNDKEIVRLRDLMAVGYQNAYVSLRAQAGICGTLSRPELGKRKIVDMQMVGELAYLTLAPIG